MLNRFKSLLLFTLLITFGFTSAADEEPIAAQWQVHQIKFHYSGFTSHYTCDGLMSTLKKILKLLGARDDIRIESDYGFCDPFEVQPRHTVIIAFAVPVYADEYAITEETFPAQWEERRISSWGKSDLDPGDCELMERFVDHILPYINARDIKDKVRCVPYKHNMSGIRLGLKVLIPTDPKELEPENKSSEIESHIGIEAK